MHWRQHAQRLVCQFATLAAEPNSGTVLADQIQDLAYSRTDATGNGLSHVLISCAVVLDGEPMTSPKIQTMTLHNPHLMKLLGAVLAARSYTTELKKGDIYSLCSTNCGPHT